MRGFYDVVPSQARVVCNAFVTPASSGRLLTWSPGRAIQVVLSLLVAHFRGGSATGFVGAAGRRGSHSCALRGAAPVLGPRGLGNAWPNRGRRRRGGEGERHHRSRLDPAVRTAGCRGRDAAARERRGATLYAMLEPCSPQVRSRPACRPLWQQELHARSRCREIRIQRSPALAG